MERLDLNEVPDYLENGKKSREEMLNYLAAFVLKNKSLFELYKFDDDFVSDVILNLLERGQQIFTNYDKEQGTFFNYFFYYVKNLIKTTMRARAKKQIIEGHGFQEGIYNYSFKSEAYSKINFSKMEKPAVPYKYKKIDAHDFLIACTTNEYRIKKYDDGNHEKFFNVFYNSKKFTSSMIQRILIILGLKSAYYITDDQIDFICDFCNLDPREFQDAVQYIKNFLYQRENNKKTYEFRRNRAYFHHRTYDFILRGNTERNIYEIKDLQNKLINQTRNWNRMNEELKNGIIHIRPTTKFVAEMLQISERQVNYYQQNAKLLGIELEE